jgi:hypothetical protein
MNVTILSAAQYVASDIGNDEFSRWNSWHQCHDAFAKLRHNHTPNSEDELALRLGFFLASWGMYRGSGFLLHKDYKVHLDAVRVITDRKYDCLDSLASAAFGQKEIGLILGLAQGIKGSYTSRKKNVVMIGKNGKTYAKARGVTDLLASKIIMGALGCTIAFDENTLKALRKPAVGITKPSFSGNTLRRIADFGNNQNVDILKAGSALSEATNGIAFPDMIILDIYLWLS